MPSPAASASSTTPKQADFNLLPDLPASQVWNRTKRYAPMGAAIGAGAAGLVNLLGEYKRQKADRQAQDDAAAGKADNDTLVVRVPQKEASKTAAGGLAKTLAIAGGIAGTAGLGYGAVKSQLPQTPAEAAQVAAQPNHGYESAMEWGIPIAAGVGTYGLVDSIMHRRKQNDLQAQLEHEKKDYSDMLGQTLGDPQAKSAAVRFPALEGFIAGMADEFSVPAAETKVANGGWGAQFTSVPAALALLSAAVAHKFVYDQEAKADQAHAIKRFAPPKAIRIETVPRPVESLPMPSAAATGSDPSLAPDGSEPVGTNKKEDADKLAGLGELAELGGVAMMAGGGKGKEKEKDEEEGEPDPDSDVAPSATSPEPVIHDLARNEARIDTAGGQTGIEAADPGAVRILARRKAQLARLLAVSSANGAAA